MNILQAGEPVLRQEASLLSIEAIRGREIQDLIANMRETMHKAPGVGLAAPQIGLSISLAVIEDKAEYMKDIPESVLRARGRRPVPFHVIINPRLMLDGNADVDFFEGCLSLAGFTAIVPRAKSVRVECLDHKGESQAIQASGWYARILQHEIDHLNGKLYVDRMQSRTFCSIENHGRYWKDKPIADVQQELGKSSPD